MIYLKSRYLRLTTGILFFLATVLLSAHLFSWWEYSFEFAGILGIAPVILAVLWIFLFGTNIVNSLVYFAGIGCILYENGFINSDNRVSYVFVLSLLSLALAFVGSAAKSDYELDPFLRKPKAFKKKNAKKSTFGFPRHVKSLAEVTKSGRFTACFGTLAVSLDETAFENDTVINARAFFGKVRIRLPEGAVPKVVSDCAFGRIVVKLASDENAEQNFTLNASATFGRVIAISCPSAMDSFKERPFVKVYKANENVDSLTDTATDKKADLEEKLQLPVTEEITVPEIITDEVMLPTGEAEEVKAEENTDN